MLTRCNFCGRAQEFGTAGAVLYHNRNGVRERCNFVAAFDDLRNHSWQPNKPEPKPMSKYDEAIECQKYVVEAKAAAATLRQQRVHGLLYIGGKFDTRVEALYKQCAFEARLKIADHMERLAKQELRKANAAARAEASGILGITRKGKKKHGKKHRSKGRRSSARPRS